jgi:hypothetical protein
VIGRKFRLLISKNVLPFAFAMTRSMLAFVQCSTYRFGKSRSQTIATIPWLIDTGISAMVKYPIGALDDKRTVPTGSCPELTFDSPSSVRCRSVCNNTGSVSDAMSFGVQNGCETKSRDFSTRTQQFPRPAAAQPKPCFLDSFGIEIYGALIL